MHARTLGPLSCGRTCAHAQGVRTAKGRLITGEGEERKVLACACAHAGADESVADREAQRALQTTQYWDTQWLGDTTCTACGRGRG